MKSQITISSDGKSIIKVCRDEHEFMKEVTIHKLNLDFIPRLIAVENGNIIKMERIAGNTLSDRTRLDARQLAQMFSRFHKEVKTELSALSSQPSAHRGAGKVICHIDTNPRNYVVRSADKKYFMIDFAEIDYSLPEHDLANFLLFWAACYEPRRFQRFMQSFLRLYKNKEMIDPANHYLISKWMAAFDCRRKKYGKTPCRNQEWQHVNRSLLLKNFYDAISAIELP